MATGDLDLGWLEAGHRLEKKGGQREFLHGGRRYAVINSRTNKSGHFQILLIEEDPWPKRLATGSKEPTWKLKTMPLLVFRSETASDRAAKAMGINREFQTGDPQFDSEVYIHAEVEDAFLHRLLQSEELRRSIRYLLKAGWLKVQLFHRRSPVNLVAGSNQPTGCNLSYFHSQLDWIETIRKNLPPVEVEKSSSLVWSIDKIILISSFLTVVAGCLIESALRYHWQLFVPELGAVFWQAVIVSWLPLMAVAFALLRGRSDSLKTLISTGFFLFLGLCWSMPTVVRGLNATLDESSTYSLRLPVENQFAGRFQGRTAYFLSLPESEHTSAATFQIPLVEYKKNSTVAVLQVKAGAFGWQWVNDIALLP